MRNAPPGYKSWQGIGQRCYNPKCHAYDRYGGRGIKICQRWRDSFEAFIADMGPRPSAKHSIDRIDGAGNYEPGNCRWATVTEQNRNKRTTKLTESAVREIRRRLADGAKQAELAKAYGVDASSISNVARNRYWHEAEGAST